MVFDLSRYLDFSLKFLDNDIEGMYLPSIQLVALTCMKFIRPDFLFVLLFSPDNQSVWLAVSNIQQNFYLFLSFNFTDDPVDDGNGVYYVSLKSQKVLECALEFQPSEVHSYLCNVLNERIFLPSHIFFTTLHINYN